MAAECLQRGTGVAGRTSRDVLLRGMRVLGHAIREEPRIFTVGVAGSVLFGLLTVGSAYVVGAVVGGVVVPAIEQRPGRAGPARARRGRA